MPKRIFLILSAFVLIFFKCQSQNIVINRLTIKYVNPKITTPIPINCNDFEKSFGKSQIYEKTIEDRETLDSLEKLFEKVKYLKDVPSTFNVRTKFYLYFLGETQPKIICMDKFNEVSIDGITISDNIQLIQLLQSCLK